ncbi:MAG: hypothetical protein AEth_01370 [Candidatus Argoarchaeum ethanivorans]|uniref:Uncharacterized protein n=1 Tax=Candidatus Argoarchaeum ethanivorans TaxID=2608793 RepID=A0A8B3S0C9_9EURY|nr:MAG: hypothetical protein AEth_01370 [Candidatus Argoarchaeum ethanivorans]
MKNACTGRTLLLIISFLVLVFSACTVIVKAETYTVTLGYGQTPYQLGYLSNGDTTGWNWWDTEIGMQQKNLVLVSIMENTTPVSGLSPQSWIRDSTTKKSGGYSWNAEKGTHSWHYLDNYDTTGAPWQDIDLTGYPETTSLSTKIFNWFKRMFIGAETSSDQTINLTFWNQYRMMDSGGFVKVSVDMGATWDTLAEYSGNSSGWTQESINLTQYSGQKVFVAFHFISNNNNNNGEWWIDDITVETSDGNIIFSNGAETRAPKLTATIYYPHYDYAGDHFSTKSETIELSENYIHQIYYGTFTYPNDAYAGRYTIEFSTTIGSEDLSASTSFNTTLWGCQARGCHDSWSPQSDLSVRNPVTAMHPDNITSNIKGSCLTMCHSTYSSQFLRATPIHLHDIKYGHEGGFIYGESGWVTIFNNSNTNVQLYRKSSVGRKIPQTKFNIPSHVTDADCTQCHTSFIHSQSGKDTYDIAVPHSLNGSYLGRSGVHYNVSCEACHGIYYKSEGHGLIYPQFDGVTTLNDTIGDYEPEFMSYEAVTKTYIIDVNSGTINVTVDGDDPLYEIFLTLVGPVDDVNGLQDLNTGDKWQGTYTVPSVNGTAVFAEGSKICYPVGDKLHTTSFNAVPKSGTWIAKIFSRSPGMFNYTITSNHSIQSKPIIHIPWNCSECHNPGASGDLSGAKTSKPIPSWDNNGLSHTHADTNDDGMDDVTCRLCHNSFHDISIRNCTDCHTQRPGGHAVADYYEMEYTGCMLCHNDPHVEPEAAAGGDCTDCHLEGGANVTSGIPIINKTGFFGSIHRNITGQFSQTNYTSISRVCWGCHVNYTQQLIDSSHTKRVTDLPACEDCHDTGTPLNSEYLNQTPLQVREHQPNGEDIQTDSNCTICHNKSLTIAPPTENVKYPRAKNYISHYGRQRTDMWVVENNQVITNCSYCHTGGGREFYCVFVDPSNADITHGTNCTSCHGSGRIHDKSLEVPIMSKDNEACLVCHSNKTEFEGAEFRTSAHANIFCVDCHTPRQVFKDIIVNRESYTYNFSMVSNITCLNATLDWNGSSILNLTLYAPDTNYTGTRINISSPQLGNWTAIVCDVSGDTEFTLTIDVDMKHGEEYKAKICEECHISGFADTPIVYKHIPDQSSVPTNASCALCHAQGAHHATTIEISASHYLKKESLETRDCIRCHTGIVDGWGNAPDQGDHVHYTTINKTLVANQQWKLVDNYSLTLIETTRDAAIFKFEKDEEILREELIVKGDVFKYEVCGIAPGKTTIVNLTVNRLFTAKDRYVAELSGTILASRIHRETENKACWGCHDSQYRANAPEGTDYYVLKKDIENVTLARMPVNLTDNETIMLDIGESLNLTCGYILYVADVNIKRGGAKLRLYKNETLVDDVIINEGCYFTYEERLLDRKIDVIRVKLDRVFIGAAPSIVLSNIRVIAGKQKTLSATTQVLQSGIPLKYLPLDSYITVGEKPETFHVYTLTPGGYSSDCISCHSGDGVAPIKIDIDQFKRGVHAGLNKDADYFSFITDDANKACWACHGNGSSGEPVRHPTPYFGNCTPQTCIHCHGHSKFGAKQVYTHYQGAEISTTSACWDCHSNMLLEDKHTQASASHYSTREDLLNTSDCSVCHNNETNAPEWGSAPQVIKHNSNNTCTRCHAGEGLTNFHKPGITITRECKDCHVNKERCEELNLTVIRTHYPGAPEDSADTLKNYNYTCEMCHNATNTTLHESLEVVRGNQTMGYCFQCHSIEGEFSHKPEAQIKIFRHGRGIKVKSGCEACHDPKGVSIFHAPSMVGKTGIIGARNFALDCIECHEEHEGREYQPFEGIRCIDCHTEYGASHYSTAEIEIVNRTETCGLCHNPEADLYHNLTHIEANVSEEALRPCYVCHGEEIDLFNETQQKAVGITRGTMATIGNVSDEPLRTCSSCHNATGESRFHFDTYSRGTVQNPDWKDWTPGNITGCKDCHTYHGGCSPFNATNMGTEGRSPKGTAHGFAPNCTICHGGEDPISFHSLAATEFLPRVVVTLEPNTVAIGEVSVLRVTVVLPPLMKIVRAEYFIDILGIKGKGKHLKYIIGENGESSAVVGDTINTSMMSYGEHFIFVRVKDSAGHWSKTGIGVLKVVKPRKLVITEFILKICIPAVIIIFGLLYFAWRRFR